MERSSTRLILAGLLALALGGCDGVLDPHGPVGSAERLILINATAIMLVIVIPVIVATLAFAWWFRASNEKATYLPEWEFSGRLELIVWSIPILVIVFLGGIAWFGSHVLDPMRPIDPKLLEAQAKTTAAPLPAAHAHEGTSGPAPTAPDAKPLEIQVVSLDWKWLFIYPEQGVAAVNTLYVPTGKPVHFRITSATVWNAFFVPQLGSMIYSMAGMTTDLHLQADDDGVYRGISGMFSGDKFSEMHFDVHAVQAADFDQWVAKTKADGPALDSASYAKLAQVADTAPVSTFKSIDTTLFNAIVAQTAPAASGAPEKTNP